MTAPATILLVEDDRDIRETLADALGDHGYRVIEAFDGLDALEHLRADARPDLILLDLMMPRMNGAELRAQLRASDAWRGIPILIITADADAHAKAAALDVAGCLRKPTSLADLYGSVARLLAVDAAPPRA